MRNTRCILLCGLLALALIGCRPITAQPEPPAIDPTTTALPAEEEQPMPAPQPPITPGAEFAVNDLAQRLNIDPAAIAVLRVEEVDWPDSGLGCPQPGMNYLQVLTNGTFIQLSAGGQLYNYHAGGGRQPFLCTSPDEWVPGESSPASPGNPDI
jgi:hypothetical protein